MREVRKVVAEISLSFSQQSICPHTGGILQRILPWSKFFVRESLPQLRHFDPDNYPIPERRVHRNIPKHQAGCKCSQPPKTIAARSGHMLIDLEVCIGSYHVRSDLFGLDCQGKIWSTECTTSQGSVYRRVRSPCFLFYRMESLVPSSIENSALFGSKIR